MEGNTSGSFKKRWDDKKRRCAPWQGSKLTKDSNINGLKEWRKKLDGLFDHVLSELDSYKKVRQYISFDGKKVRCKDHENNEHEVSLKDEGHIIVVGTGKASYRMAKAIHEIFGDRARGVVTSHKDLVKLSPVEDIEFQPAGHPDPDEGSVEAAEKIIGSLEKASNKDIVVSLISGGGSAMMELPVSGGKLAKTGKRYPSVCLQDYIIVNDLLNKAGFNIEDWNAVRKHLSQVKGGRLAKKAENAACVFNLIVSDVNGDKLDVIASGPFVEDPSTFVKAYRVLKKLKRKARKLKMKIPESVKRYIKNNRRLPDNETLKVKPHNVFNSIIASNDMAIDLSLEKLRSMGIHVTESQCIHNLSGDVEKAAVDIYTLLLEAVNANPDQPTAVIAGGEATVDTTRYPGYKDGQAYGGRMQMMAALMMNLIKDLPVVALFAATDGGDGKAPNGMPRSAGAIIDGTTLSESQRLGVNTEEYINTCNTYEMHSKLSTQLLNKEFVTNVMDLVGLVYLPMN